jgi:hypothetical protein
MLGSAGCCKGAYFGSATLTPWVLLDLKHWQIFLFEKTFLGDILGHDESSTHVVTFAFLSEAS